MRTIDRKIAGGFIFSTDNKLLLCKMAPGGAYAGLWVVPGGGIEDGESPVQALAREIQEEVGLSLANAKVALLPGNSTDEREKTLRNSGERVLVRMKFHDYEVKLPYIADDADVTFCEEFTDAQFFSPAELPVAQVAPATYVRLKELWPEL
jgi:8-oxo-dGTP pyrophosphatase MutT (NUDIX family)